MTDGTAPTPDVAPPTGDVPAPRRPSLGESLLVVAVLIGLIATSVILFGIDAASGPLQVALFGAAAFAGLMALRLGHRVSEISNAAIGGISSAMAAIFILVAVGALIGTFFMAGTIATVVYYGLSVLSPTYFYFSVALLCGIVGLATGSSWTTAATLGVAFMALAPLLGASLPITAGAVISGAYFGDKMTPISETTVLVPSLVGGVTVNQHIAGMVWSSGPAYVIALTLFALMGFGSTPAGSAFDPADAQQVLASEFAITPLNLLPLLVLILLSLRRMPPFLSIFSCAVFAGILAWFTQPEAVASLAGGEPGLVSDVKALYIAMGTGFESTTGVAAIDQLFSGGGMTSMLTTIWLILGALSFAAIAEHAGFLGRIIEPVVRAARSTGALIAAVVFTAIGLNLVAGDQYVAVVMPSRVFRLEFARRGIAPRTLSRTVEDAGTVTSPLVPWNSCGAYMSGVLGVTTFAYLPYCFFNIASPIISLIYGFTGFRIEHLPGAMGTSSPPAVAETGA